MIIAFPADFLLNRARNRILSSENMADVKKSKQTGKWENLSAIKIANSKGSSRVIYRRVWAGILSEIVDKFHLYSESRKRQKKWVENVRISRRRVKRVRVREERVWGWFRDAETTASLRLNSNRAAASSACSEGLSWYCRSQGVTRGAREGLTSLNDIGPRGGEGRGIENFVRAAGARRRSRNKDATIKVSGNDKGDEKGREKSG